LSTRRRNRCVWCGSDEVVTSVSEFVDGELLDVGWICKECYDRIPVFDRARGYVFGYEGFIDEHTTVWDVANCPKCGSKLIEIAKGRRAGRTSRYYICGSCRVLIKRTGAQSFSVVGNLTDEGLALLVASRISGKEQA
jgi:predicted RNA-binding Zn-ribbon protein involved in translation (DUF1610 family)